jgi:hypothetical protein
LRTGREQFHPERHMAGLGGFWPNLTS